MIQHLQLAQHFHARVCTEPVPIKKLVALAPLIDQTNTIKPVTAPLKLPTDPVIYRTPDRQCEVINGQQVLVGASTAKLHPESLIYVLRLTEEADLPMARLCYQILEPARIFNEIDGLIHAAYAQNHLTALLNQYVLQQPPSQPITAKQLERLCAGRSRKSTLNNRKSALGYTDANLGCKATQHTGQACPA